MDLPPTSEQVKLVSTEQLLLHPSRSTPFPSSHPSIEAITPSPQTELQLSVLKYPGKHSSHAVREHVLQ